jgi:CBS domain-containing protein
MSENHIGALLVMDEGRLAGIFTERDALNRVLAEGRDPVTLGPHTAATLALDLMGETGFRHLPVVENDDVYGIISPRDFVGVELHLAAKGADG